MRNENRLTVMRSGGDEVESGCVGGEDNTVIVCKNIKEWETDRQTDRER